MFKYIGHKIVATIGVVVVFGLFGTAIFYSERQEESIFTQNEHSMRKLTESVSQALQTVMLAGYADVAQIYAEKLKNVREVADFRILRVDGHEAFLDNATIDQVNKRLGDEEFIPKATEKKVQVFTPDNAEFLRTIETQDIVPYYETTSRGERFLTFLAPIKNQQRCYKCHGQQHPIRGILKLTTSLNHVQADISDTWKHSFFILAVAVVVTLLATYYLLRKSVVDQIVAVSVAMRQVSDGNLKQQVPEFGQDEVGTMARSFNHMARELLETYSGLEKEQDKLTTIILAAREGMVVTNAANAIVLVNPAAEFLLEKSADQLREEGFFNLFDDPEKMQTWLVAPSTNRDERILKYKDHILDIHVETIRTPSGAVTGSAALIRDVTEERRLEDTLRMMSTTDALTGLRNRRFLDQTLIYELNRARQYDLRLSIIMFDIDHFKKFNDTYGHDQGDRVLKAVAQAVRESVRRVDIPCRYGGEEFLIILPDTDAQGAMLFAERLRHKIEIMRVDNLQVTVSIGVATYGPLKPESPDAFIEAADKALYTAKEGGRNRVIAAAPS